MAVLAVCSHENPNWALGALLVLVALVIYVGPIAAAFKTAPKGTRPWLAVVYLGAVGISVLFGYVLPGGLSSDNVDYLGLFIGGVLLGGAAGLITGLWRPAAGVWRHALLGTLGGGTFLAGAISSLFFVLATTNACLD